MDKEKMNNIIGILAIVLIIGAGASLTFATPYEPYVGGWEIGLGIDSINVNQRTYTIDSQPENTYSFGTAYAKFDVDNELTGTPDITVRTTGLAEYISREGEWVKSYDGEAFKILQKEVGDDIYFFYQHVFFFELGIIAEGQQAADPLFGAPDGECDGQNTAIVATISVFLLVDANLWAVLDTITSDNGTATYKKSNVWTGMMSASVVEADGGYVNPLPTDFAGHYGLYSITNVDRLNMFHPDGAFAEDSSLEQFESNPSTIQGVPTSIITEVAGTRLQPAWWKPPGAASGRYAVEATYRVRLDVVTSALYTFELGDQDDTLNDVIIHDETEPLGLFDWFSNPFASFLSLGIILIGAVVLVMIFRRKRQ